MVNIYNQSTIQRMASVRSQRNARCLLGLNIPFGFLYVVLLWLMGLVIYAYFTYTRCDPFESGAISNRNQVTPYFVVQALRDTPGMAGLYIATLFSAGLSTVSSGICALAANTVEDFIKPCLNKYTERTATIITKFLVAVYGLAIIGLAFAAASLDGPVTQLAASVFGSFGSPVLGVFLTAACVPWVNSVGAISGGTASFVFNMWIAIGNRMHGRRSPPLVAPPIDGCSSNESVSGLSSNVSLNDAYNITSYTISAGNFTTRTASSSDTIFLYDISYEWYSVLGTVISVGVCFLVSFITRSKFSIQVRSNLLLPFLRRFWNKDNTLDEMHDPEAMESLHMKSNGHPHMRQVSPIKGYCGDLASDEGKSLV